MGIAQPVTSFESIVNSIGSQTVPFTITEEQMFESIVNSIGSQTRLKWQENGC